MTENYLSGKKRSLKLGILNYTEDKTTLEVIGNVGIGTTNPTALVSVGNTAVLSAGIVTSYKVYAEQGNFTGVVTASSFAGDGSGLVGVAATDHVATFDLVVAGISTFNDDVRVIAGGIDVTSGVVTATQFDVGTGGIDVDGQADLDELVVAGVSTFSAAVDINAGLDVDGQTDLDELVVAGVSTFTGNIVAATADFSGNVTIGGTLTVEDKTNVDSIGLVTARSGVRITSGGLIVTAGVTTFTQTNSLDDINVNTAVGTAITIHAGNIQSVGIITASKFIGDGSGLANLPGINTEAASVFTDIVVSGGANVTGIVTAASYRGDGTNLTGIGTQGPNVQAFGLSVAGISTFHDDVRVLAGGVDVTGVVTATSFSGSGANLTGIGTQLANVQAQSLTVAGISTFHDDVRILGGGVDVTGVSTFNDNLHLLDNDKLILGGSAGTYDGLEVYHNGSHSYVNDTGTGGLYVGGSQIYFSNSAFNKTGININPDTDTRLYYNNSQKFATTAVGATVYGNSKATTLHIAGVSTLTGDVTFAGSVNQINVTGVSTFAKAIDLNAGIDVDGQADLDEVVVAGVSTFSGNVLVGSGATVGLAKSISLSTGSIVNLGDADGLQLYHSGAHGFIHNKWQNLYLSAQDHIYIKTTATGGGSSGENAIICTQNGSVDLYYDNSSKFETSSTGATLTGKLIANELDISTGGIDVDGQSNLDEVVVAGVSTFSGKAVFNTAYPSIDADNEIQVGTAIQLGKAGVITATSFSGSGANLTGIAATDHVSTFDLVVAGIATFYNDVKIVGGGSTAGNQITIGATTLNDGTLTFDGTAGQLFSISNNLTDGSIFSVNDVSGMPSIDVGAAGTIQLAPYGAGELVGIGTTRPTSKVDVVGDVQVVGVLTATTLNGTHTGDGSALTGIAATSHVSTFDLVVAGISTFNDDVRITAGGLNVASGIISATQLDIGTGGIDVDGQADLDELVVAGVSTFSKAIDLNAGIDVDGQADLDELVVAGVSTFSSAVDINSSLDVDGDTQLDDLNVAGITTLNHSLQAKHEVIASGGLTVAGITTLNSSLQAKHELIASGGLTVAGVSTLNHSLQAKHEVIASGGLRVAGVATFTSNIVADGNIDLEGDIDVNGTCEADAYTVNGTALDTHIAGVTVTNSTNSAHTYVTDNESTAENNLITFVENAQTSSGNHGLEMDGNFTYTPSTGTVTATLFSGSGASLTSIPTGINTANTSTFKDIVVTGLNASGVVTASSFSGDGSALTGIEAGGTGDFYVGFTSSVTMNATSYEATGHTFPSTVSKTYTIDSIMAANVSTVGVGTTVNLIASISSNSGVAAGTTEQTYIAYNVPLAAGGAVELLKEPMVANPNDIVKLWATNAEYVGIASAIQVHMTYTQQDSTDFFGKYASNISIASTTITGIHTAGPTYAAALQSIHLTNRSDAGAFPVDIMLTNSTGVVTTYLVKNLVIPRYSAVEILERPKRMETGSTLGVKVQQTGTIDVVVSGKKYS